MVRAATEVNIFGSRGLDACEWEKVRQWNTSEMIPSVVPKMSSASFYCFSAMNQKISFI